MSSYKFKDSSELHDAIGMYHEIYSKNSNKDIFEGYEIADKYILEKYGDPEKWDTSNVTDMSNLFYEIYEPIDFSNYDISNWDTSNVTNMSRMFKEGVIHYDISKWNVDKVEDMSYMFFDCEFSLESPINLSKWNIKNKKNTKNMFMKSNYTDFVKFN